MLLFLTAVNYFADYLPIFVQPARPAKPHHTELGKWGSHPLAVAQSRVLVSSKDPLLR